jgi:hypothetical protein
MVTTFRLRQIFQEMQLKGIDFFIGRAKTDN